MRLRFKKDITVAFTTPDDPDGYSYEYRKGKIEHFNLEDGVIGGKAQLTADWCGGVIYVEPDFWKDVDVSRK